MRLIVILLVMMLLIAIPAKALDIMPPTVPETAKDYMPGEPRNLSEGIREILRSALGKARPDLREATKVCVGIFVSVMLIAFLKGFPGKTDRIMNLAGTVSLSALMLSSSGALINLASDTVAKVSDYGRLLLPAMTSALAAQGGITASSALYAGTALFDSVLSSLISSILIPLVYTFLALSTVGSAIGTDSLKKCRDWIKWLMTWILKTILYIFTGYISITGVISGTTDAAALKAAKLTISGVVPVVGGILSDASEAILVSAGTVKNAVGLYGLLAIGAIWIGPFMKIGIHYMLLRLTGILCSILGSKSQSDLIQDFASAMGLLLGMTGAVCLMFLISLICFMKGVG